MSKSKLNIVSIILTVIGIYPIIMITKSLFIEIKSLIKTLCCKHEWRYWKLHLHCTEHSGINDTVLEKWRRCDKCGKQQEMNMIPKEWGWKSSYQDLPEDSDTIHYDIEIGKYAKRRETISDIRDKKLNQILGN